MSTPVERPVVDARIARGAATNFLGTLAKILHPAFFVLANRLYEPAQVGLYVLATTIVELAAGLVNAGWRDAVLLVGGQHADRENPAHQQALYDGLGQAVQAVLLGSTAVTAIALRSARRSSRSSIPRRTTRSIRSSCGCCRCCGVSGSPRSASRRPRS